MVRIIVHLNPADIERLPIKEKEQSDLLRPGEMLTDIGVVLTDAGMFSHFFIGNKIFGSVEFFTQFPKLNDLVADKANEILSNLHGTRIC